MGAHFSTARALLRLGSLRQLYNLLLQRKKSLDERVNARRYSAAEKEEINRGMEEDVGERKGKLEEALHQLQKQDDDKTHKELKELQKKCRGMIQKQALHNRRLEKVSDLVLVQRGFLAQVALWRLITGHERAVMREAGRKCIKGFHYNPEQPPEFSPEDYAFALCAICSDQAMIREVFSMVFEGQQFPEWVVEAAKEKPLTLP